MDILLIQLSKIFLSVFLGLFIGFEREKSDKPCGLRTVSLICLGATLITIFSVKLSEYGYNFDMIRAIAYYLVAIGFIGGGIISQKKGKIEGLTTASVLLPVSILGFVIGLGEYLLAIVITVAIYIILKLRYIKITFERKIKKRKNRHGHNRNKKKRSSNRV